MARLYGLTTAYLLAAFAVALVGLHTQSQSRAAETQRLAERTHELQELERRLARADDALAILVRDHERVIQATLHAPSVGTRSWGHRFEVTKYLPRAPEYGRFNDGLTATLTKADPMARIVAVDPKIIPYGSWVWVETQGWFRAEDCGSAIKGFRLDLMTATRANAMQFGRQDLFVIVVPPVES